MSMTGEFFLTFCCPPRAGHGHRCASREPSTKQPPPQLSAVIDQLAKTQVTWIFVDVAGVTFADTTLPVSVCTSAPPCPRVPRFRYAGPDR